MISVKQFRLSCSAFGLSACDDSILYDFLLLIIKSSLLDNELIYDFSYILVMTYLYTLTKDYAFLGNQLIMEEQGTRNWQCSETKYTH